MAARSKFQEAVRLITEAEELKAAGDVVGAVRLYRRGYLLEPSLDPCRWKDQTVTDTTKEVVRDLDETDAYLEPLLTPPPASGFRTFDAADLSTVEGRRDIFMYAEEYGFVVVDNVLSAGQISDSVAEFKKFMLANDINMDDVESVISGFGDRDLGIVSKGSIGQSRFNWLARSNAHVKDAFRAVLGLPQGEGKLITSFDGSGYFLNPEIPHEDGGRHGRSENGGLFGGTRIMWYHFDAGSSDVANYFQGLINYIDCTADTEAGIVVLPKSHKTVFPRFFPAKNESVFKNYLSQVGGRLASQIMDLGLEERPMRVPLKAGSMVLFRSSLIHCNMGCVSRGPESSDPSQIIRRLVSYVCMVEDPKDASLTKQRKEYFNAGKSTAHQPDILRWVGDRFKPELAEKGVLCMTTSELPDGGEELL